MKNSYEASKLLENIVNEFSKQSFPNVCTKVFLESYDKPMDNWSLGNQILTVMQGSFDARTYNQWKEVKRYVKAGSKAIYILVPNNIKVKVIDEDTKQEKEEIRTIGFLHSPRFKVEDTNGEPLPESKPKVMPQLTDVAKAWGIELKFAGKNGSYYGSFSQSKKEITQCTENEEIFFHELAHAGHARIEKLKGGQDARQEAIAELTACVLAQCYGKDIKNESWNYIAEYAKEKTPEAVGRLCLKVLGTVKEILKMIIETHEQNIKEVITV